LRKLNKWVASENAAHFFFIVREPAQDAKNGFAIIQNKRSHRRKSGMAPPVSYVES